MGDSDGECWLTELVETFRAQPTGLLLGQRKLHVMPALTSEAALAAAATAPSATVTAASTTTLSATATANAVKMTAVKSKLALPPPSIVASSLGARSGTSAAAGSADVIKWRLLPNASERSAGAILKHCTVMIQSLIEKAQGLLVYKIGISQDCNNRFFSPTIGYNRDKQFSNMLVLHAGHMLQSGMLEASLVQFFRLFHPQGLQNVSDGGEGISNSCMEQVHLYVVYKCLPMRPPS